MAVFLSPVGGAGAQFFDNNGDPLSGGKLYTYDAGTTTPRTSYTTSAGNVAHANPIVLDAAGRVQGSSEIWLTESVSYKFVLKDSNDVLLATWDNISGIGAQTPTVENFTGTGSQTLFALSGTPTTENLTNVYVNGVYQQKNTYSVSAGSLLFSEAPPATSKIEINYA
jgi:hypothetical protein